MALAMGSPPQLYMGTMCEANTVIKCCRSDTHKMPLLLLFSPLHHKLIYIFINHTYIYLLCLSPLHHKLCTISI